MTRPAPNTIITDRSRSERSTPRWSTLCAVATALRGHVAIVIVCILVPPLLASAPTQITLRVVSRLEESRAIALRDIATITGPDADALASIIIIPDPTAERGAARGWRTITTEQVRLRIAEAGEFNWGRIVMTGGPCAVRIVESSASSARPSAVHHAPIASASPIDPSSLRARVTHRLASVLGVEPQDIRAAFDPRDESLLAMNVAGATTEIEPIGRGGRLALRITVYRGDHIVAQATIDAQAEVRRRVAIARAAIRRGETITEADVTIESQWIASTQRVADPGAVIGTAAKAHIQPGQFILERDTHAQVVVSRGDIVSVHVVSGSLVVESRARALATARDGDIVEFESLEPDAKQRSRFKARMNGRGRAVMLAETTPTEPTR